MGLKSIYAPRPETLEREKINLKKKNMYYRNNGDNYI